MSDLAAIEKGKINKIRYGEYVDNLELMGEKFPINNFGHVNKSLIAQKCGFKRQVFFTNKSMKQQLETDVKRIGLCVEENIVKNGASSNEKKSNSNDCNRLMKALDIKEMEILSLRKQINELLTVIRKLESDKVDFTFLHEELLTSGRRFTL